MWIIACFFVLRVVQGVERVDPLVETKQGIVSGLKSDDGDYSMFLGIPYGKVDQNNPFGVATPYPKFEETFLAHDDSAVCPQVEEFNKLIVGSLDCLNLNIFVPSVASSRNRLPVLIWIHGGGFQYGYGNRYLYGPKYLIRHEIILVTMNYRLGAYGFMCLDTPEVPGNQGLKDQLLALRWINENIGSFGGDVNKLTLMGQSAGAGSVEVHLGSKQEKLFNQAIMQSGSLLSPWAIAESNFTAPLKIANHLGYEPENLSDAISFLAKADAKLVIAAVTDLSMEFKVCVENKFENVESILNEHPRNLTVPKARTTPILTGFNSHEWMLLYINKPESAFKKMNVFNKSLNEIFNYDEDFFKMEDIVRHFYLGDEEVSKAVQWNLIDFASDYDFVYPIQKSIRNFLQSGAENIYHYVFSYNGERNFIKKRYNVTEKGASHSDELSFLFDMIFDPSTPSDEDQRVIDMVTALWTNFVKYGDPTPRKTELLPVKWSPVTKRALNYLNINLELSEGKRPANDRVAFWDLFFKANENKLLKINTGAGSVEVHLRSKQEKLFNQAIMQSGSLLSPWAIAESNFTAPLKIANHLGYEPENLSDAISFLAKADAKLVIAAVTDLSMEFKVCVENKFENVESILNEHPRNLTVPKARTTPILTGFNSHEWMLLYINKPESAFKKMNVFNKSLNEIFNYDEDFFKMEDIVRHFYLGDEEVSKAVQWNLIDFASDYDFVYPIQKSIRNFLQSGAENIYHYVFSYNGERNFIKKRYNVTEKGASHSDELSFLFDMIFDPSTPSDEDQRVIDMVTTLWTNFVKYGDPTPRTTELLPVKWSPVTKRALNYLNINLELSEGKRPTNDRVAFWDLFFKANENKLLKVYKAKVPVA